MEVITPTTGQRRRDAEALLRVRGHSAVMTASAMPATRAINGNAANACRRRPHSILVLLLVAGTVATTSARGAQRGPSILEARDNSLRITLVDAFSTERIAGMEVEIWSDNGIRCGQAPCSTNGRQWKGRADGAGILVIPKDVLQAVTSLRTAKHSADLIKDAEPDGRGGWVVELVPSFEELELGPRAIKVMDRSTGRPIANQTARVDYRNMEGRQASWTASTNRLGWLFVPFEVAALAEEAGWLEVTGYRRMRFEPGTGGRQGPPGSAVAVYPPVACTLSSLR
jgi:hypothetical protein